MDKIKAAKQLFGQTETGARKGKMWGLAKLSLFLQEQGNLFDIDIIYNQLFVVTFSLQEERYIYFLKCNTTYFMKQVWNSQLRTNTFFRKIKTHTHARFCPNKQTVIAIKVGLLNMFLHVKQPKQSFRINSLHLLTRFNLVRAKSACQRHYYECFCHYSALIKGSSSAIWPTLGEQMLAVLLDHYFPSLVYRFCISLKTETKIFVETHK